LFWQAAASRQKSRLSRRRLRQISLRKISKTKDALFALTALALDLDAGRLETVAPTQARATLDGLVTASLTSDGDLATMGNLSLFLDFANNAFTGETSDFANYRYVNDELRRIENLTGTLDLSNTKLLTTVLTADLSGVLSSQADNFSVDADMVGLVTDQNGRIVVMGYIEGQSASAADGIIDITGGIFGAAE